MLTPARILIVEDEPVVARGLGLLLQKNGYEIAGSVTAGADAVRLARELAPDLVLMDIMLADDIDGVTATQEIQGFSDIPVIYLTSLSDDATLKRIRVTAPFGYVMKPVPERELVVIIESALQRCRLDHERQAAERHFRQIVELSPESIFVIEDNAIVFMNTAACRLLGQEPDAEPPPADLVFPADLLVPKNDAGTDAGPRECTVRLPDGATIDAEILSTGISYRNRPAIQLLCRNVTARNEAEVAERQAHKMEAIGRLAGGIAHDFNNLLTAILGYCELAQLQMAPQAGGRDEIDQIRQAAERASSLTRQLLAFSRHQTLQFKLLDPGTIIRDMEKLLRRVIGEDIRLEITTAPNLPLIMADASQMQQILINLAVNARDAMPDGGVLEIAARELAGQESVELTVSDTGHGMSPAVQRHLFEPFFTTKAPGRGTGLGLPTVYGIVTQSGGTIAVESETGHGTLVRIRLPAADPDAISHEEPARAATAGETHGETILLVEDESLVRSLAASFLRRDGYRVLEAADGISARDTARGTTERIDLLVSDIILPDLNGEKVAELVTDAHPETRVLLISGYGDARDDETARTGRRLLQKPFTGSELLETVRQILHEPRPGA